MSHDGVIICVTASPKTSVIVRFTREFAVPYDPPVSNWEMDTYWFDDPFSRIPVIWEMTKFRSFFFMKQSRDLV